jgi:hypothetical protein
MIREIIGFLLGIALAVYVLAPVASSIRTGRIHHTDSTSTYSYRKQPRRFVAVVVLFVAFGAMFLFCAVIRAIAIWHHLSPA